MSELDELERDLLAAADTWFSQALHLKLQRLIALARDGENAKRLLGEQRFMLKNGEVVPLPSEHAELPEAGP